MRDRLPVLEEVAESEISMNNCLDIIENVWLKDKPFLAGDTISVADIFGICEIDQPRKLYIFSITYKCYTLCL